MARIRTRGNVIDTARLGKDLAELSAKMQKKAEFETAMALNAIVEQLKENSANRLSSIEGANTIKYTNHVASGHPASSFNPISPSSGTKDQPFKNAKVVSKKRKAATTGLGDLRLNVYVDVDDGNGNNLFNILDAGTHPQTIQKAVYFPRYRIGTQPLLEYNPVNLHKYFRKAPLSIDEDGRVEWVFLPAGYRQKRGIKPRGYYAAVAEYVKEILADAKFDVGGKLISMSDETMKLIIIRVSDGARLKKI